ncbi:putative quinol monooxygenase [Sphingomonas profundi]|uniref:putative quinol monooxygenase n=1 Tax=Alterirhizorhabdus profundi TaxID=2681549 RepID=UPI0012E84E4E|nr:antibiotic biosynthesis monooxygenase family protein [Sphingomonas profundi]
MVLCRTYDLLAADDRIEALRDALVTLAGRVRAIAGCEGVQLFQDADVPAHFLFVEQWATADAHRAGGVVLGKAALSHVLAALATPPAAATLMPIALHG